MVKFAHVPGLPGVVRTQVKRMDITSGLNGYILTGKLKLLFHVRISLVITDGAISVLVLISLVKQQSLHIMDPRCLMMFAFSILAVCFSL